MAGWKADDLLAYRARMFDAMAPARPFLVHLRSSQIAASIDCVLASRDARWAEWVEGQFHESIPARTLGLERRDAMVGCYVAWEDIASRLYAAHTEWKLELVDPHLDWPAAIAELHRALAI